jgi:hypothetical protein
LDDLQRRYDDLQRHYDELKLVKERSDARYKADLRKFNTVKAYLRSEKIQEMEDQLKQDYATLHPNERKRRRAEITAVKEKKIEELNATMQDEIGVNDPSALFRWSYLLVNEVREDPLTTNLAQRDKENQQTPVPDTRKPYRSSQPLSSTASPTGMLQSISKLNSSVVTTTPLSVKTAITPTLIASSRRPLQFHSLSTGVSIKQPESVFPLFNSRHLDRF